MNKKLHLSHQELVWTPFFILLYREIQRFMKVLAQTIFIPATNSFIILLIFGVSLGKNISILEGVSYLRFLIPGLVMMGCMNNSYENGSTSLLSMKFGGEIIDIKSSPLTTQQIIWAMSLGGLLRGLVVGSVMLVSGEFFCRFYEQAWLIPRYPLYFLLFCCIGGLAFTKLGICVAFWGKNFDHVSAVGGFLITPLVALGGVYFSLNNLSPFWVQVSYFNPLFYFINGVRYGVLGVADVPVQTALWVSLAGLLLFHIAAVVSLKKGSYQRW